MFTWQIDEKIHLGLLEPRHAPELAQLVRANAQFFGRWLPFATEEYGEGEALEFIQRSLRQFAANMGVQAAILLDHRVVGMVGLHLVDWGNRSSSLGYWLDRKANGQGIMTRAAEAIVHYAFRQLQLHRLEIRTQEDNLRSQRVAERLGFVREGVLVDVARHNNRYVNFVIFARVSKEDHMSRGQEVSDG